MPVCCEYSKDASYQKSISSWPKKGKNPLLWLVDFLKYLRWTNHMRNFRLSLSSMNGLTPRIKVFFMRIGLTNGMLKSTKRDKYTTFWYILNIYAFFVISSLVDILSYQFVEIVILLCNAYLLVFDISIHIIINID